MPQLVIVADVHAKADKIELVKSELLKLVPITRTEAGCVQYDLQQDNSDPAHFLFYEIWESRDLWQDHINAPHLDAMRKATDGAIENLAVYEMAVIS